MRSGLEVIYNLWGRHSKGGKGTEVGAGDGGMEDDSGGRAWSSDGDDGSGGEGDGSIGALGAVAIVVARAALRGRQMW